ncbi:putative salt-induced outer membrane protein [Hasllibacter halocynthiae]|uniref:Putative salt-induced outer membrane protein n=1 Tax=Hasllibacter halocynthiae TaxID=595589 RepID=A0A2T0X7X2_9RHOB|nr:DUF481 domain-containing protein [Hasllibacter halocynthiae]PRY95050.1 putative salt-induced outer membrane protein [Hasllibacter halocynthiae]
MMIKTRISAIFAAALLATAGAAQAQAVLVGTEALDDRVDDLTDVIDEDFRRGEDEQRFGFGGVPQGFAGSAALGFSTTSGNTETTDITGAGRITYGRGANAYTFGFGIEYGETDDEETKNEAFLVGEYSRQINGPLYAFGLGSYQYDEFGTFEDDLFIGAGLGYRILATPSQTWRVQAGPGARYTETQLGDDETELAGLISSRYYQQLTPTLSLTNDTAALYSDEAQWTLRNDFGLNFAITDRASTRISYVTDYVSDPLPGAESTDNRLGVSLVYGF